MLNKGYNMFLRVLKHSGDKLSPAAMYFIPGLGIIYPRTKSEISRDRTLGPKNHDKNTKKPTGG